MSFSVPSFVTKRSGHKKPSKPASMPSLSERTPPPAVKGSQPQSEKASASKKRVSHHTPDQSGTSGSRSSKRFKNETGQSPPEAIPPAPLTAFIASIKDRVPSRSILEWDSLSFEEAASRVPLMNMESLFLYLKHSDQIAEAARGNSRVHAELFRVQSELKAFQDDRKKLLDSNRKLYESEGSLIQEKEKLLKEKESTDAVILKMKKDKEDATKASRKEKEKLELKVRSLQGAVAKYKVAVSQRDNEEYNSGYKAGVKDYMTSMYEAFPDLDWSLLGQDAVEAVELIKQEQVVAAAPEGNVEAMEVEPTIALVEPPLPDEPDTQVDEVPKAEAVAGGSGVEPQVEPPPVDLDAATATPPSDAQVSSPADQIQ